MPVYRRVKVIVENHTNAQMTVEGAECQQGQWTEGMAPKQGDQILGQSSQVWSSESQTLSAGTSAFVRLGSVYGYIRLGWSQPWVGEPQVTADCAEGLHTQVQVNRQQPDAVVVSVALGT
jgi:hypothetical protein